MLGVETRPVDCCKRALTKMRSPYEMDIICIDVTNKCDLACSNCTRLLDNQDYFWDMTPENFRLALRSLEGYTGIIAMIGGNPSMHRNFKELCQIFKEEIPNKEQRGLWTNNIFKYNDLAKETFGIFNLNPHGDERGIKSLAELKDLGWYHEGHSSHAPLLTAVKDLFAEEEMWERISRCDINHNWSASIMQINGKIRAYFCEIGGSFDAARGEDHGVEAIPGWWRRHITEFEDQARHFCPGCGVPAKLSGHMDSDEVDTYTESNADLAKKSLKKKRKIIKIESLSAQDRLERAVTDYSERLRLMHSEGGDAAAESHANGAVVDGGEGYEPITPRPWIKPVAELCLTIGRTLHSQNLSDLGERLWRI